jgi:uncharacterized protein YdiU (UPF0061 family)
MARQRSKFRKAVVQEMETISDNITFLGATISYSFVFISLYNGRIKNSKDHNLQYCFLNKNKKIMNSIINSLDMQINQI